jgi:glycosyltransferase involved in cell wall biosynthesis
MIRQQRIDLVHTNVRLGHDREGILAAQLADIPCVCHVRDFEQLNWFDRKLADRVDAFIYISEAVQRCHLEAGVPLTRGRILHNAVDTSAFYEAADVHSTRHGLGLSDDELAVGLVGRLERWKGHEVFLQAMAAVKETVPCAKGVIIGDPVPYDPLYGDELSALRDKLGLADNVLLRGFQQDIRAVMSGLDVVVLASTSPEPFGRVLIEAMAAGKPVIATDAGATREIIEDGVHGLIVEPGEARGLAKAIVKLCTDRQWAVAMGRNGLERVRKRFSIQQHVAAIENLYCELLTCTGGENSHARTATGGDFQSQAPRR